MEIRRFNTVLELMDHAFSEFADLPSYSCMGHAISYAELDHYSRGFAAYIQQHTSLKPGDRIAIQLPNILQYPIAVYGAIRAGLVIVNTNPLYTARELCHQLEDSGAKALVVLSNCAHTAAEIISKTPVEEVIVTDLGDIFPGFKRTAVNFAVKYIKKMVPPYEFKGVKVTPFLQVYKTSEKDFVDVEIDPGDLFALQYTGGTTGVAKGAMLTHSNLSANVYQILGHMTKLFKEQSEVFVAALPLYHIFAFNLHALCAFSCGAHNVLIPNPRDLPAFVKAITGHKVSAFIAVNTLYNSLARNEEFKKLDFSSLKTSAAGGMAVTEDVMKRWLEVTGCEICEGYGLTETSPVIITNPDNRIKLGTIGTPLRATEIQIIDDDGVVVRDGEPGEICARGPQVMKGYWQRPEATAEVLNKDGWFRTGDIGIQREDGYFEIVDRKKDMIVVSGFKVFPNEVEDIACQHPGVLEAAVIGVPSEATGEAVKLFIVKTPDSTLSEEEMVAHCRAHLTGYKVPKLVVFRETLPKSNVGKILRKELRNEES